MSRAGSCWILEQRTVVNCTSSFSVRDPGPVPSSRRSFWKGSRIETWGNGLVGRRGASPWTTLGCLAPHLHRPVDVEVMQEGVLHLGQNPAEELKHLLPHAWGVLRAGSRAEPGVLLLPPSHHCSKGTFPTSLLPSLFEPGWSVLPIPLPLYLSQTLSLLNVLYASSLMNSLPY